MRAALALALLVVALLAWRIVELGTTWRAPAWSAAQRAQIERQRAWLGQAPEGEKQR